MSGITGRYSSRPLLDFLFFWAMNTLALWVADFVFADIWFDSVGALWVSGLILGLVNAVIRPVLVVLTLPLTIVTLGLFLLILNTLMVLLVAWLVPGFHVTGFWTGFWVALFMSLFSSLVNLMFFRPRLVVRHD